MTPDEANKFREELFKAGQKPSVWFEGAQRLRSAAENIFTAEQANEVAYFRAYTEAQELALSIACAADNGFGTAEIKCHPPNYLPGQLLSAFALENAFKGLMIANDPTLAGDVKMNPDMLGHDLAVLAKRANFSISTEDEEVLNALSQIGEWAGRYPVAVSLKKHDVVHPLSDVHELLDYGSKHVVVRRILDRAIAALDAMLTPPRVEFGVVVMSAPKTK